MENGNRRKRGEGCIYQPKGSANWWIKYTLRGKSYPEPTGSPDRAVAEEMLEKINAKKKLGQLQPGADKVTFEQMIDLVKNDYRVNEKKSLERVEHALKHLSPFFGGRKASAITSDVIDNYILERRDLEAKNSTINNELAVLRRGFNLAIEKGKIYHKPHVSRLRENNVRRGFFELAEFLAVRDALPEYLKPVVTFAFFTGWRKEEILSLRWNQVDLQERTVRLDPGTTKNDEARVIALEGELWELIQGQWENRKVAEIPGHSPTLLCPYVFHHKGQRIKDFRGAWKKATNGSGRLFHDLRRSAIKNMMKSGVREKVAMQISGHKTRSVFDRYHIVDEEELREASRKTTEHIQSQRPVGVVVSLARKA